MATSLIVNKAGQGLLSVPEATWHNMSVGLNFLTSQNSISIHTAYRTQSLGHAKPKTMPGRNSSCAGAKLWSTLTNSQCKQSHAKAQADPLVLFVHWYRLRQGLQSSRFLEMTELQTVKMAAEAANVFSFGLGKSLPHWGSVDEP